MNHPDELIRALELQPHPEGGCYQETYRAPAEEGQRSSVTAIYYLLRAGERSHWHRVDATEIWHWYAGAPLALHISPDGRRSETHHLGNDFSNGQRPQVVLDPHVWQSAESLGDWTLVGCTVAPGFEFSGFELAPEGWTPQE